MAGECVTLWVGDRLGPVERACLRSVLRHGHSLALYCYRAPTGVPEGVELRDAAAILPENEIFFHASGSVAIFADWFRLELQRRGAGTWLDTDVYLLRSLETGRPYLFGEEEPQLINNAVLRLPADSPMLPPLLRIFETTTIPAWLPWRYYLPAAALRWVTGRADLSRLPFGTTGPFALTAAAHRFGLLCEALPSDVFYPAPWKNANWINDPTVQLGSVITPNTVAVHVWNECIKHFKDIPANKGSFLDRLQREGRN
jgi:hypothetical protein